MSIHTGSFLTGEVRHYAGATAPAGWLFCFGQALDATTSPIYQDLFNVIGNTYGGTNNTNFVVPDLRGRSTLGKDNMGGTAAGRISASANHGITGTTLGSSGGAQLAQLASHSHGGTTPTGGAHTHQIYHNQGPDVLNGNATGALNGFVIGGLGANNGTARIFAGNTAINGFDPTHAHTINADGSATAHNVPPAMILNFIIKI